MAEQDLAMQVLQQVVKLPVVKVDSSKFLVDKFSKELGPQDIPTLLEQGPTSLLSQEILDRVANACIRDNVLLASGTSVLAGLPGGLAMAITIPADVAQFYAFSLKLAQELGYIYGYEDLWVSREELSEDAQNTLLLYLGVMLGVNGTAALLRAGGITIAKQVMKTVPNKALTKTLWYPILKKVLKIFGVNLTKGEGLSVKSFCQHLLQSSKLIWNMNKVLLVLFIISTSQAVINVTVPISTLFLRNQPFLNLQTGQSLALLSTFELSALIVGSLVSGYLQHTISIKTALYASLVIQLLLLVGFATVRFDWILIFSTLDAFFAGVLSPRLQELVFKQIPEESMGAVQSSIGAITVVLPSLFTIALVTIATSFGTLAVSFVLLLFLLVAFVMLLNIRESI
ncbi:transporter%2C major facilitator family protein [Streptococcus pneumoniae]|uniref:hypothetical protein n=1 Tax=Streptococcus pneumoniae TaxID=1313 RepID=UPI0005E232BA|nr:hypothetical protein [Streptococcus pneumoniae]COL81062.1 transporter%2C major facilitator family protein [Streptococcus pneumoniae]